MRRRNAFTLIELLIVVAIIAILAAIAVPNFLEAQTRSKVSRAVTDMRSMGTALEAFRVDNNSYPTSWSAGTGENWIQSAGTYGDPLWSLEHIPAGFPKATLTTPIAYLTSTLQDIFMPRMQDGATIVIPPGTWQYGVDRTAREAWALESVGPDARFDSPYDLPNAGGGSPTNLVADSFIGLYNNLGREGARQIFLVGKGIPYYSGSYDPSNGTKSAGDLVRLSY